MMLFIKLIWLEELVLNEGIAIEAITIDRSDEPGMVNVQSKLY